jgi:hypothetical protein
MGKEQFGLALRKIVPEKGFRLGQKIWVQQYGDQGEELHGSDGKPLRKRVNGYHMPSLEDCRTLFCDRIKWKIEWGDEGDGAGPDSGATPPRSGGENDMQTERQRRNSAISDDFELRD